MVFSKLGVLSSVEKKIAEYTAKCRLFILLKKLSSVEKKMGGEMPSIYFLKTLRAVTMYETGVFLNRITNE